MNFYTSIVDILEDIRQDVLEQYEQRGLRAAGKLDSFSRVGRRGRSFFLSLPFYAQYITKFRGGRVGRGPGKFPPVGIIEQWIKDKGLLLRDALGQFVNKNETNYRRTAFLISRKIAKEGTDIYQGKRQPIDLDQIINNRLDYRGKELADRILMDLRV